MPGFPLIQLAAVGPQNNYLTGNPQITFFVAVYKRHTNFAIETIEFPFVQELTYGGKSYHIVKRFGDLIHQMFLHLELPALNSNPNNSNFSISWVNGIGNVIIRHVEIRIGDVPIDRQYGEWLEIWNQLTLEDEKLEAYYTMVGRHVNFNSTMQQGALNLRIPFSFWFNRNIGLSLPLIALQKHDVTIHIELRDFDDLWVSNTGTLTPLIESCNSEQINENNIKDFFPITSGTLYIDYIFLDDTERRKFARNRHEYLIEQVSPNMINQGLDSITNVVDLTFNHPVKELIWVIRNCTVIEKIPEGGNEWINFSNQPYRSAQKPQDPMTMAKILFDGRDRFDELPAFHFNTIYPYQYHTRVPNNTFIHVYSFAIDPEKYQPSGSANFSRLDSATMNLSILENLNSPEIIMFAPNYNVLIIEEGLGGLLYSN